MPVKVRCTGCETTLCRPDKARGKSIARPKCGTKIKVPAEAAGAAKTKKKEESEDFLERPRQDRLGRTASMRSGAFCARLRSNEDDPVCPKCGMNAETGRWTPRRPAAKESGARIRPSSTGSSGRSRWPSITGEQGLYFKTAGYWLVLWMLIDVSWLIGTVIEDIPLKIFWFGLNFLSRCAFGAGSPRWRSCSSAAR